MCGSAWSSALLAIRIQLSTAELICLSLGWIDNEYTKMIASRRRRVREWRKRLATSMVVVLALVSVSCALGPRTISAGSLAEPTLNVAVVDQTGWLQSVRVVVPAPRFDSTGDDGLSVRNEQGDETILLVGFLTRDCASEVSLTMSEANGRLLLRLDRAHDTCTNDSGFSRMLELRLNRAVNAHAVDGLRVQP